MNKPNSKVIQISEQLLTEEVITSYSPWNRYTPILTALCEDGSIWRRFGDSDDWSCILEAPTPPQEDLPAVGSKWRHNRDHQEVVIENIKPSVSYKFECGAVHRVLIEQFLESYEPIPQEPNIEPTLNKLNGGSNTAIFDIAQEALEKANNMKQEEND